MSPLSNRPTTTHDLLPSERIFVEDMRGLRHGRFENLRIERGELVLAPPPIAIRHVRFGASSPEKQTRADFRLKRQVAELFEYVRAVEVGEIRILEIREGLPWVMHITQVFAESTQ